MVWIRIEIIVRFYLSVCSTSVCAYTCMRTCNLCMNGKHTHTHTRAHCLFKMLLEVVMLHDSLNHSNVTFSYFYFTPPARHRHRVRERNSRRMKMASHTHIIESTLENTMTTTKMKKNTKKMKPNQYIDNLRWCKKKQIEMISIHLSIDRTRALTINRVSEWVE